MNRPADTLLADALLLPDAERADLATRLIESLDPGVDDDVESAWGAEIRDRLDDLDAGRVRPVPWHEARCIILGDDAVDVLLPSDSGVDFTSAQEGRA